MNEFSKHKIAFSVAFLAILFSINPLVKEIGILGYSIYGKFISINHLYYFISVVFALSVYAYGIQFLSEKRMQAASTIGNSLYALAMASPWLYGILFLVIFAAESLGEIITPLTINIFIGISGAIVGAAGLRAVYLIQAKLSEKDQEAVATSLSRDESLFINRAMELLSAEHFDLSIIEAFRAIEASAKKALLEKGVSYHPNKWVTVVFQEKLLPTELSKALNTIWQARNKAAHGAEPISKVQAYELVSVASRIVAVLGSTQNVT